ncbi:baseplate assembly protein [Clostridium magnum]|uniref:Baseplate J-like protein n=1 Tax=Clostridium magnum DSM 2767 TaxID=1121326 RepID=A0A162QMQ9_9CLOT|nr:baseplate J/gp47 family protein [Clostridium magnum]KZL88723.1 baseplate J-like protein [Clostridium magnum DSM 2767]SHJ43803.1 Phage-related baseplate assembly protein [Clostridium magnum DSM 2767]
MDLKNLPDVEFAYKDIDSILNDLIAGYEQAYYAEKGEQITLYPGDKIRIFLYSQALREFQLRQLIDFSAKQNLLKYAVGDYLVNLGAFHDVEKSESKYATVTEKFNLSAAQSVIQIIPKGTRVGPGTGLYFATTEDIDVPIGATDINITMQCTTSGTAGNNFTPGQINVLMDPLPWISSVTNVTTSSGGTDSEDDDTFREIIRQAPEGYSVAGPSAAYEYFAKKYNSSISNVKVSTSSDAVVNIIVLLENGEIPTQTFLDGLNDYLSDKSRRPLTDKVQVAAPTVVNYDINLTYYILRDNSASASTIQSNVNQAIEDYKTWQKSKIKRDINPSELIARIIKAGAKRVEVISPTYTALSDTEVAAALTTTVTYGGLEDD